MYLFFLAEREGFEPPEPRSSTVFKTAAIDHSATSPFVIGLQIYAFFLMLQKNWSGEREFCVNCNRYSLSSDRLRYEIFNTTFGIIIGTHINTNNKHYEVYSF